MKKTSIFVVLITFLASIFLISFFGAKVIDEQFKTYVASLEITTFTGKKPSTGEKYYIFTFDEEADNYVSIDYEVEFTRKGVSEEGLIEFAIISGNSTFEEDGETYDAVTFYGQNVLVFYKPATVTVELRSSAKDGRGIRDVCQYICMPKEIEE